MTKLITKIELQGADKIKTMINLLEKYLNELPDELVESLRDIADCESCSYDWHDIKVMLSDPDNCTILVNDVDVDNVTSVNLILKEIHQVIKVNGSSHIEKSSPKGFSISDGDRLVMGW